MNRERLVEGLREIIGPGWSAPNLDEDLADYIERLLAAQLEPIRSVVNQQAEDEALWCIADNIVEAHFQQELRRLHAAIETNPDPTEMPEWHARYGRDDWLLAVKQLTGYDAVNTCLDPLEVLRTALERVLQEARLNEAKRAQTWNESLECWEGNERRIAELEKQQ